MKKIILTVIAALALATLGLAQTQNMQAASGTTGDLAKPTGGFNIKSGQTLQVKSGGTLSGAGTFDFSAGTSLIVPNSAAPTTTTFGWLAGDNNAWAGSHGTLQFFDGTANVYVLATLASSTPSNGYIPQWNTGGTITWVAPAAGSIGGSSGSTDKAIITANGTGGATVQGNGAATVSADAVVTLPRASLAANTSGDGLVTSNSGTPSSGNQLYSPRLRLTGNGWKTNATAGGQLVDWIVENRPVQGAASPTTQLAIASQVNAGGFTDRMVFDSGGSIYLGPSATAGSIASSSGAVSLQASNTNANININPIGTGVASVAYAAPALIVSDDAANRTWKGQVNSTTYGSYGQVAGGSSEEIQQLAVGGGDVLLRGGMAGGTYASLSATAASRNYYASLITYGGSTWYASGNWNISTTETQSETARGCQMTFTTVKNTTLTRNTVLKLTNDSQVLALMPLGGIGYGTGAGGTVTQATSRTTGVTLNTICGALQLVSAAGTTSVQSFTVTDSAVTALDTVVICQKNGTDIYQVFITNVAAGSFRVTFFTTGGTTTEQPVFNFAIIRTVAS